MSNVSVATKVVAASLLPTGVTFDRSKGMYRARKGQTHLGYFRNVRKARLAVEVATTGVSVDSSRNVSKFRVRIGSRKVDGYYKTRSAAVRAILALAA